MDTCDGQQGRIMTECNISFYVAPATWEEIGMASSSVVSHPIKETPRKETAWMQLAAGLKDEEELSTSAPIMRYERDDGGEWALHHLPSNSSTSPLSAVSLMLLAAPEIHYERKLMFN